MVWKVEVQKRLHGKNLSAKCLVSCECLYEKITNKMIKIILPGEPISRVSPTFSKYVTYDKQKHLMHAAKFQVLDQIGRNPIFPFPNEVPIELEMNYFFPIPKGKENLFYWGLLDHTNTPDTDNLTKFYGDVLKNIAFVDDRQVNIIHAKKEYSENPRTEIYILPKKLDCSDQVKEVLSSISPQEISSISEYLSTISEWCLNNENPYHLKDDNINIDYEEIAIIILEFAEKHADSLKKLNKKFPGLAKILKERIEDK